MTPLQAADFREFLSNELTANGFSDIVDEVNFRLLERFNDDERPLQGQNEILFFSWEKPLRFLTKFQIRTLALLLAV